MKGMSTNFSKNKLDYLFLGLLIVALIIALIPNSLMNSRLALAGFLIVYILITKNYCDSVYHYSNKKITLLMLVIAILYVILYYSIGLFTGYNKTNILFNFNLLYQTIIPIVVIIICSEKIRKIFLKKKDKLTQVLLFISEVMISLLIYSTVFFFTDLERILIIFGIGLVSSVSENLLFNYMSVRYGEKPILIYRMITSLFIYIIPFEPDIYSFFKSFYKFSYPAIVFYIVDNMYGVRQKGETISEIRNKSIIFFILLIIFTLFIGLISCKFYLGLLTIGSSSMAGTIDVGDAIVFHKYNNEELDKGKIIVFNKGKQKVIHRIVDKSTNNNKNIYYTKGDANKDIDSWVVNDSEIVGIVDFKIKYIGYPTILVNDLINNRKEEKHE